MADSQEQEENKEEHDAAHLNLYNGLLIEAKKKAEELGLGAFCLIEVLFVMGIDGACLNGFSKERIISVLTALVDEAYDTVYERSSLADKDLLNS